MPMTMKTFGAAAILAAFSVAPLAAQTPPDPLIDSVEDGAGYARSMLMAAADRMSEEDYAFRPTPDVRSFGQLLAHVAQSNYGFCSAVKGEPSPAVDLEKTATTKADIRKALSESYEYCDRAFQDLETRAQSTIEFMGAPRPILAVRIFQTHHSLLHYGNVVTYMRLRGKVPPSTDPG